MNAFPIFIFFKFGLSSSCSRIAWFNLFEVFVYLKEMGCLLAPKFPLNPLADSSMIISLCLLPNCYNIFCLFIACAFDSRRGYLTLAGLRNQVKEVDCSLSQACLFSDLELLRQRKS